MSFNSIINLYIITIMEYKISEDDLKILVSQTNISKNEARKLLIKNKGNISECILEAFNHKDSNLDNDEPQTEAGKKLLEFRKILDEKDTLFCQMIEKNKSKNN